MNVRGRTSEKVQGPCCALAQICCSNNTPIEELCGQINRMKDEAKMIWNTKTRMSGERACYVIISPGEDILRNNLKLLNFQKTYVFNRRNGYPKGMLEMWMLSW